VFILLYMYNLLNNPMEHSGSCEIQSHSAKTLNAHLISWVCATCSAHLILQLVIAYMKILLNTQWWILVPVNHGSHLESSILILESTNCKWSTNLSAFPWNFMLGWLRILNYMNNDQHDALLIFSLLSYHTSTCFGRISSPSSEGRMYICGTWYLLYFWVDCQQACPGPLTVNM
jgi:hypothetical protein